MRMDVVRGPDVETLLVLAIRTSAVAAGCAVLVEPIDSHPWASATFVGTRHRLRVAGAAVPDVRSWIGGLPDNDLPLRGHIVADLIVERVEAIDGEWRAVLAVLTLIEA